MWHCDLRPSLTPEKQRRRPPQWSTPSGETGAVIYSLPRCCGMPPRSARTSVSRYRRCPPSVRIDVSLPAFAQRVTVFGSTRNIVATSAGVSNGSASGVRVLANGGSSSSELTGVSPYLEPTVVDPPHRADGVDPLHKADGCRPRTFGPTRRRAYVQILPLVQDVRNGPSGSSCIAPGVVRDTPFSSSWRRNRPKYG